MKQLTVFSWGYRGWGNATRQLVAAVDAVERSRGFRPPIFVDVRLRRNVRAKGFNGNAFASVVASQRYKHMPRLGNKQIAFKGKRGPRIVIRDPRAASDLLDVAINAARKRRRVVFFCACEFPKLHGREHCHRHRVGTLLLREARRRGVRLEVAEWPGGRPSGVQKIQASRTTIREASKNRWHMPLEGRGLPIDWLARPLGTPAILTDGSKSIGVFTGWPAFHRGWQLSWVSWDLRTSPAYLRRRANGVRREYGFAPRRT